MPSKCAAPAKRGLFGDTVEAGPRPACQDSHRECRLSKARRSCGIACALNFCRPGPSGPERIIPGTVFCAPEILHEGIGVSPVNGGPGENELEPEGTCSRRRCESPPAILWFLSHRWERNSPRRAKPCKVRRAESLRPPGVMVHGGRAGLGPAPTGCQAKYSKTGQREGQSGAELCRPGRVPKENGQKTWENWRSSAEKI